MHRLVLALMLVLSAVVLVAGGCQSPYSYPAAGPCLVAVAPHRKCETSRAQYQQSVPTYLPLVQHSSETALTVQRTIAYLQSQYNPEVHLLQESPETAPNTYWLFTDNRLAAYALAEGGDHELAAQLQRSIEDYLPADGMQRHGLIEALGGELIEWPPRGHRHQDLCEGPCAPPRIRVEFRDGELMQDWDQYADLSFIGALDAWHRGNTVLADQRFRGGMSKWDGVGFRDAANASPESDGFYATYKLALAVRTAAELEAALDPQVVERLLDMQEQSGGFVTLYDTGGTPRGDSNTETSAHALLALLTWSTE